MYFFLAESEILSWKPLENERFTTILVVRNTKIKHEINYQK